MPAGATISIPAPNVDLAMTSIAATEDDTFLRLCKKTEGEVLAGLSTLSSSPEFRSVDYVEKHRLVCDFIIKAGWDVTEFENLGWRNFLNALIWE